MQGSAQFPAFTISDGVTPAAVVALIFVVKWLVGRSDKQQESMHAALVARDRDVSQLIATATQAIEQLRETQGHLREALSRFAKFEQEEVRVHDRIITNDEKIMERLDKHYELLNGISASLERTTQLQEKMLKRMEGGVT